MTQTTDPNIADRAIMIFHLERALRLLRNHEGSREECERTKGLIAHTEARIASLRALDAAEYPAHTSTTNEAPAASQEAP